MEQTAATTRAGRATRAVSAPLQLSVVQQYTVAEKPPYDDDPAEQLDEQVESE